MNKKSAFTMLPFKVDPQPPHTTFYSYVSKNLIISHCSTPTKEPFSFYSHIHNEFEMIYVISGQGFYGIEDKKYFIKPDMLILSPPLEYHSVEITKGADYDRIMIIFPVSFIGNDFYKLYDEKIKVLDCSKSPLIKDIFKRINYYQEKVDKEHFEGIVSNLLQEVFVNMFIDNSKMTKNVEHYEPFSPIITQALNIINANLFTIKSIKAVSDKLFITEAYFFRLFKSEMKISPKKYITNKRLMIAQNSIQLGEKPTVVCYKCGFDSYTAFYKRYVNFFGFPPSERNH